MNLAKLAVISIVFGQGYVLAEQSPLDISALTQLKAGEYCIRIQPEIYLPGSPYELNTVGRLALLSIGAIQGDVRPIYGVDEYGVPLFGTAVQRKPACGGGLAGRAFDNNIKNHVIVNEPISHCQFKDL